MSLAYDSNGQVIDPILNGAKPTPVRTFETGATRSPLGDKLEYSRFFDARVMKRWAEYMHRHRKQTDGNLREPDNWKSGITQQSYVDSLHRHFQDVWLWKQGYTEEMSESIMESLTAILFNTHGLLFELEKAAEKGVDYITTACGHSFFKSVSLPTCPHCKGEVVWSKGGLV